MNLSDVYVFKKVAATLSFTKAARQIGVSRSAVSKQVSRLEQDLGAVLINRTTRNVNLTEAGREFDSNTSDIDVTIERAAALVRGADLSPLGTVRFALPSALGALLMPAFGTNLQEQWPALKLSIEFDDCVEDPIAADLDFAVRISKRLNDSSLISRRLFSTRMVLAASPGYLDAHGEPERPSDLDEHRLVVSRSTRPGGARWRLQDDQRRVVDRPIEFTLAFSCDQAKIIAANCDAGIICVPELLIAGELARDQLKLLLEEHYDPEPIGVYVIYPHRNATAKVKVLVDIIEQSFKDITGLDRPDRLVRDPQTRIERIAEPSAAENRSTTVSSAATLLGQR